MFEQFTERARKVIFFARYEASQLVSGSIEPEHILLGLLREDTPLRLKLPSGAGEAIRREIETRLPKPPQPISTSVDLPISHEAKAVLIYAGEKQKALQDEHIDSSHLVLGLLRLENNIFRQCCFGSTASTS
ncbi:MAG: Clp protease N-terminal domain-containing protein [Bryobacteraceae bacterium]